MFSRGGATPLHFLKREVLKEYNMCEEDDFSDDFTKKNYRESAAEFGARCHRNFWKNNKNMQRFKVGDKVWDAVVRPGGKGVVDIINSSTANLVGVLWEDGNSRTFYSREGQYVDSFAPTLSHTAYELTGVDNEPRKTKRELVEELIKVRRHVYCMDSVRMTDEIFKILDIKE